MISVFKKCLSSVCWAQTAIKENKRIYLNPYPIRFHRTWPYLLWTEPTAGYLGRGYGS